MRYYILHKQFITNSGSIYWPRTKPYAETELPVMALTPKYSTLSHEDDTIAGYVSDVKEITDVSINISNPSKEYTIEVQKPTGNETKSSVIIESKDININKASLEDLLTLPGVTESVANRVLAAKKEGRVFKNTLELDTDFKLPFGRTWKNITV